MCTIVHPSAGNTLVPSSGFSRPDSFSLRVTLSYQLSLHKTLFIYHLFRISCTICTKLHELPRTSATGCIFNKLNTRRTSSLSVFISSAILQHHVSASDFSLTRTGINRTFLNDLICLLCEASEGNMAQFTSLVGNIAWRLELPSPQLVSQ